MALTGSALLAHHSNNWDKTASERVLSAGYLRADGIKPSFTNYYIQKMRAEVQKNACLSYGRKIDMETVESVKNYKNYKNNNTRVECKDNIVVVYLYNIRIAYISEGWLIVNAGNRGKTTKSRLNRILMHFCGLKLYQKNYTWYVVFPGEDVPFQEGMVFDII